MFCSKSELLRGTFVVYVTGMSLIFAVNSFGKNLYVSKGGPQVSCPSTFNEIQQAVAAAQKGDDILVCPGTYTIPVEITKSLSVTFQSTDISMPQLAMLQPTAALATTNLATGVPIKPLMWIHNVSNGNVKITGLTVDGTSASSSSCASPCQYVGILVQNVQNIDVSYMAVRNIRNPAGGRGFGIFAQSGNSNKTQIQVDNSTVTNYENSGILANETGTSAQLQENTTHGLGESATAPQTGVQIGFGAKGQVQRSVSTDHTGPAPHCANSAGSSTNFVIIEPLDNINVQLQNNTSVRAEIGIGVTAQNSHIQNNSVSDTLCNGIYVSGNKNEVHDNSVFHTDPTNLVVSTAIYVYPGDNNHVHGNTINEAVYGIVSASPTTQENGDTIVNVMFPLAGDFQHANPHFPHDPTPALFR